MIQIHESEIYTKENNHIKVWISPFLSYGDYDNSCHVERSNYRVFKELYGNLKNKLWIEYTGSYGHNAIAFLKNPNELKEGSKVRATLEALEGYPAIDDEDVSYMEMEMIENAIREVYIKDIADKLFKLESDILYCTWGSLSTDTQCSIFWELIRKLEETGNFYPEIESGGTVWIDTDLIPIKLIAQQIHKANEEKK